MIYHSKSEQIDKIVNLSAPKRYNYLIKQAVVNNIIWSLHNDDGWVLAANDNGVELVPIWPDKKLASLCAMDQWSNCSAKSISLDAWINRWIPGMINDNRLVAVFPVITNKGIIVKPEKIRIDLLEEINIH